MSNYPTKVFLNGDIIPHQDAKISVFDRGFIFGDGVYEVMVQLNGSFFYGDAHLKRLSESLQKIKIDFDVSSLQKDIARLLKASQLEELDCMLYIQISRGVAPRKHAYPKEIIPTTLMYAIPFVLPEINQQHMVTVSSTDQRWSRCDIKMTSLLGNIMANEYAAVHQAYETILIRDEFVTEASHCNIFFVKNGVVFTHPANQFILDGITRKVVIRLCHNLGIEIKEEAVKAAEMFEMDEVFLTGTTTQIASVKQIDNHCFYEGDCAGTITSKLQKAFALLKQKDHEIQLPI